MNFEFICNDDDTRSLVYHNRSVSGNSIVDHLIYYGVILGTEVDVSAVQNGSTDFNSSQMLGFCKTTDPWQRF